MSKRADKASKRDSIVLKEYDGPPVASVIHAPQDIRLSIAIAAGGDFKCECAIALTVGVRSLNVPVRLDLEKSCYVHRNRNRLMERAMASDSTHLLFLDTDISFPSDAIPKLLGHQKDVIGGAYNARSGPNENGHMTSTVKPMLNQINPDGPSLLDKSKMFECRAIPTGFMLLNLDTLRTLPLPECDGGSMDDDDLGPPQWFDFGHYSGFVGEDIYFCDLVRNQGVRIFCDPTIPLGHVGEQVY